MNLEKRYLETLFLLVKGTEGVLNLAEGRIRDRFMKGLTETVKTFEEERKVIYEKFCNKHEDGSPDIADGNYHFDPANIPDVNKELETLYSETVEIQTPAEIKDFVERTEYKPKTGETEVIDTILSKI